MGKVNFKRNHKGTRFITLAKSSKVELLITGDKTLSEMIELEKTELEKTVILYQELLEKLIASHNSLSKQEVLEILLTRDAINNALSDRVKPSALVMLEIERLDSQLKENGDKLIQSVNLAEYRNNFPNLPDTWWWYLDIYIEDKVIGTMVWAGNLALLGNLASFFLNSASGLAGSV